MATSGEQRALNTIRGLREEIMNQAETLIRIIDIPQGALGIDGGDRRIFTNVTRTPRLREHELDEHPEYIATIMIHESNQMDNNQSGNYAVLVQGSSRNTVKDAYKALYEATCETIFRVFSENDKYLQDQEDVVHLPTTGGAYWNGANSRPVAGERCVMQ